MVKWGVGDGTQVLGLTDGCIVILFTERRKLRYTGKTIGSDLDILIWKGLIQVGYI